MTNIFGWPRKSQGDRLPLYLRLKGRLIQPDLEVTSFVDAPRVRFKPTALGVDGEPRIEMEFTADDNGVAYKLNEKHPEDDLIERIAMVLTHPVMVGDYFQLLEMLDLDTDAADDFVAVKQALLNRL